MLERADGVLEIRFHTDGGYLRWGRDVHREWPTLFRAVGSDPDNKVIVMTGTGEAWTGPREQSSGLAYDPVRWDGVMRHGVELQMSLLGIDVPIIAAVNGPVLYHVEIPLLADIVLATEDTVFQDRPHLGEGYVPGDGMHVVMPLLMGRLRAGHFLLTGEAIAAEEARAMGLVNEVLPRGRLLARAHDIASGLSRQSRLGLRYTRILLTRDIRRAMEDALQLGLALEGLAVIDRFPPNAS